MYAMLLCGYIFKRAHKIFGLLQKARDLSGQTVMTGLIVEHIASERSYFSSLYVRIKI